MKRTQVTIRAAATGEQFIRSGIGDRYILRLDWGDRAMYLYFHPDIFKRDRWVFDLTPESENPPMFDDPEAAGLL